MNSILPAIRELERLYDLFSYLLPNCDRPVITIQTRGKKNALGWMAPNRWQNGDPDKPVNEINISAEDLKGSPLAIAETLIHEMVHHFNQRNGIKDCSGSQYHNKKFRDAAQAAGLLVEEMAPYGWARTSLGPDLLEKCKAADIDAEAFSLFRREKAGKKSTNRQRKYTCPDCGQIIRAAGEDLNVVCGEDGAQFELAD